MGIAHLFYKKILKYQQFIIFLLQDSNFMYNFAPTIPLINSIQWQEVKQETVVGGLKLTR